MGGPTLASLFCGIGGLDLGFQWAGAKLVWAADNSQLAVESYALNFQSNVVLTDLAELDIAEIPDVDIIVGGPPCQSFSLVGQRRADDERGKLVFRFVEIIRAKRPKAFLLENVPGIEVARIGGKRLSQILENQFEQLGYFVSIIKLNAVDFLVPQSRKRVFIVGSLSAPVRVPDPIGFSSSVYKLGVRKFTIGALDAIGDLGAPSAKGHRSAYSGKAPSLFASMMRGNMQDVSLHETPRMSETDKRLVCLIPPGGNYRDVPDQFATPRILKFKATGGRTSTYGRLHPDRPSATVNTYFRRPNVGTNFHPTFDRLITVREAMRLQSIPDRFELAAGGAQDARNALIGNAVPPLLAEAIGRELIRSLNSVSLGQTAWSRQLELELGD